MTTGVLIYSYFLNGVFYFLTKFCLSLLNNIILCRYIHAFHKPVDKWKNMLLLKTVIWILFSYYIWYWYFILRRNQCDHTCTSIVKFCELTKQKKMAIFPIVSAVLIFFIEFTIRFYYNLQQLINLYVWCMLVYCHFGHMNVIILKHAHFMIGGLE